MRLIFIGGCERSGTSLVQKVLASHSRIAGGPELVFTGRIAELYRRMSASYPPEYSARIAAFYNREELAEAFRGFFASLFRKILERKPGAVYLSEKTPSNIFAAARLLEIFPDSCFVHVIRDGRDVLASHRDVRKRFESGGKARDVRGRFRPHRVCARWNRTAELHFELADDARLAERYFSIKYEDLLLDPPGILAETFGFLGLDVEAKALAPEEITASEMGIPIDGFWYTEEMYRQGFDRRGIGRWKRSLPPAGRVLGGLLMAANLKRLSYPVGDAYVRANRIFRWVRRTTRRPRPYRCAPTPDRPFCRSGPS